MEKVSLLWDIQKLSGHSPGQDILGGPAWDGLLDHVTSSSPFQPQPACDAVILFSTSFLYVLLL